MGLTPLICIYIGSSECQGRRKPFILTLDILRVLCLKSWAFAGACYLRHRLRYWGRRGFALRQFPRYSLGNWAGSHPRLPPRFASAASMPPCGLVGVFGRSRVFVPRLCRGALAVRSACSLAPAGFPRAVGVGAGRPPSRCCGGSPLPAPPPLLVVPLPLGRPLAALRSSSLRRACFALRRSVLRAAGGFRASLSRRGGRRSLPPLLWSGSVALRSSVAIARSRGRRVAPSAVCRRRSFPRLPSRRVFFLCVWAIGFCSAPLRSAARVAYAPAVGGFALAPSLASRVFAIRRVGALCASRRFQLWNERRS